jgi:ribosomal protein S18 acetylase RimI-like enzyme
MDREVNGSVNLRPVTDGDREFLLDVYAAGREIELSVLPFDEAQKRAFIEHQFDAQTTYYQEKYAGAMHDIILLDREPVGRIYVNRGENLISILDLAVLTEHRKNGIGTSVITSLQSEAADNGQRVGAYVEPYNPSQNLFRELGFELIEGDETNLYFEWSKNAEARTQVRA